MLTSLPRPTIGERIAHLLEERGQSAAWLADRVGVPRSTISRIIRGERTPTQATLRDVAVALGMACEDLVEGMGLDCPEIPPDRTISREHFDTAIEQMLRLEREATDLRTRLRQMEDSVAGERTRRVAAEAKASTAEDKLADAERKAQFYEAESRKYHDALELAFLDITKLRAELEALSKATDAGSRASQIAAALAGIAAVASVAAYVTRATQKGEASSRSRSSKEKRKEA